MTAKIGGFDIHPAAALFPLIEGDEFNELVNDISTNGLEKEIEYILEGKRQLIIDGRNRLRACLKAKVKPRFHAWTGKDVVAYIISLNLRRRHMDESQRAIVAAELAQLPRGHRNIGQLADVATQKTAAKMLNVGQRSVTRAKAVLEHGTREVVQAVKSGRLAVAAAAELAQRPRGEQREIVKQLADKRGPAAGSAHVRALVKQAKKRDVAAKLEAERTPLPVGPFRVIVADFPWQYDNSDGHPGSRGHTDYPTMTVDQGCALGPEVMKLAHPEGCIMWFWVTNAHLVDGSASRILAAWGFRPVTPLTWKKNKLGMGSWLRNQTEHCILAIRGNPTMVNTSISTWFEADVREHSRKPERFYEIVEQTCPGTKIEMFSRGPREGYARWGAESEKFAESANAA